MRFLLLAFGLACVGSAHAASLWEHNGSTVYLEASGTSRKFYYEAPRPGLSVKRGTLLFNGVKNGDQYSGTAYVFSMDCGPIGYRVNGTVSADQRSVTMSGKAPRRDATCRIIGYRDDELVFTFQDSSESIDPAPKKLALTLGKDAHSLHLDYNGRTIYIEFDGHYVEHDWYALEDMFTQDKRLKTFVILGRTTGIRNAFAMIHSDGRRYVVLDTERDGHDPGNFLTLGHEIGHHICGHTIGMMRSNPWEKELEADRVAGVAIRTFVGNFGALEDVMAAAYRIYSDTSGSATHPPQHQRIAAVMEGYRTGTSPCFGRNVALPSDPTEAEQKDAKKKNAPAICQVFVTDFCRVLSTTRGDRSPLWHLYGIVESQCNDAGIAVTFPKMVKGADGIWAFPGIDCSTRQGRLVGQ